MLCIRCNFDIADNSEYCPMCGFQYKLAPARPIQYRTIQPPTNLNNTSAANIPNFNANNLRPIIKSPEISSKQEYTVQKPNVEIISIPVDEIEDFRVGSNLDDEDSFFGSIASKPRTNSYIDSEANTTVLKVPASKRIKPTTNYKPPQQYVRPEQKTYQRQNMADIAKRGTVNQPYFSSIPSTAQTYDNILQNSTREQKVTKEYTPNLDPNKLNKEMSAMVEKYKNTNETSDIYADIPRNKPNIPSVKPVSSSIIDTSNVAPGNNQIVFPVPTGSNKSTKGNTPTDNTITDNTPPSVAYPTETLTSDISELTFTNEAYNRVTNNNKQKNADIQPPLEFEEPYIIKKDNIIGEYDSGRNSNEPEFDCNEDGYYDYPEPSTDISQKDSIFVIALKSLLMIAVIAIFGCIYYFLR